MFVHDKGLQRMAESRSLSALAAERDAYTPVSDYTSFQIGFDLGQFGNRQKQAVYEIRNGSEAN